MAKDKVTITADRTQIEEAKDLTGIDSTSAVIDKALSQLVRAERLRRDVMAYTSTPPTDSEVASAAIHPSWVHLSDDTDWDSVYEG